MAIKVFRFTYIFILIGLMIGTTYYNKPMCILYCTRKNKELNVDDKPGTYYTNFDVAKANLKFLPEFKSPCILEKISGDEQVYSKNKFLTEKYSKIKQLGGRLKKLAQKHPQGVLFNKTKNGTPQFRIRCLPYFMVIGVAKSGTSDFYYRAISHPDILAPVNKELYFWSQFRFQINASLGDYMDLFDKSVKKLVLKPTIRPLKPGHYKYYYPSALSEYTSTEFTDNVFWQAHPLNKGLLEPKYVIAHDLYAVNPKIKLIVLLRNPTTRLYSSYNMYNFNRKSPEDFHSRVVASIQWWRKCTEMLGYPRRKCAYGCPPEMPPLVCILTRRRENNRWPGKRGHYSGEIRRGMYAIFAKDWLNVFPRKQILFLKTEENSDFLKTFNEKVLPFLGLKKATKRTAKKMRTKKHRHSKQYLPMLKKTKIILDNFYAPFNNELAILLQDKKWMWRD